MFKKVVRKFGSVFHRIPRVFTRRKFVEDTVGFSLRVPYKILSLLKRLKYYDFDPQKRIFNTISIENSTECNLSCEFCPQGKIDRPNKEMDTELFEKIVNELAQMDFGGVIQPFLNNEPFLDDRMVDFVKLIREKCPKAHIRIATNGIPLTEEKFHKVVGLGLDELIINDYTQKNSVIQKVRNWNLSPKEREKIRKEEIKLRDRFGTSVEGNYEWLDLNNQAGNLPDWEPRWQLPIEKFCKRPFEILVVGVDGSVLLCCQDWGYEEIMGNVKDSTLLEIWSNEKFNEIREKLWNLSREGILCERCDA